MHKLTLLAGAVFITVACGSTKTYHCDFRTSEDPEDRCQERSNNVVGGGNVAQEGFKATCETAQGDGGDGPCTLDGAVAGCDITATGSVETVIDWYYDTTLENVQTDCDEDGGTVVDP